VTSAGRRARVPPPGTRPPDRRAGPGAHSPRPGPPASPAPVVSAGSPVPSGRSPSSARRHRSPARSAAPRGSTARTLLGQAVGRRCPRGVRLRPRDGA
jgi:hypothetical protein